MAIRSEFSAPSDVLQNQYIRVQHVLVNKDTMDVYIAVFSDVPEAGDEPHTVEPFRRLPFDMYSTQNVWQQAYEGIKQWFPESVDC